MNGIIVIIIKMNRVADFVRYPVFCHMFVTVVSVECIIELVYSFEEESQYDRQRI